MDNQRPWPRSLDVVSAQIGLSRDLVQGPGGNTSWKRDKSMWVKASGKKLADALDSEIFCQVSVDSPLVSINSNNLRPSIETTLHAVRKESFVIHTHSVGAIALGLMTTLGASAIQLLKDSSLGIVEYVRPGISLAKKIQEVTRERKELTGVLLKNHGLVLWGEDMEVLYEKLLEFERSINERFPINTELLNEIRKMGISQYLRNRHLTPDHAVFASDLNNHSSSNKDNWLLDFKYALENSLSRLGSIENLDYLNEKEVCELQNWEMERARKVMNT